MSEIGRGRTFSYITFNYDTILEKSYRFADRDPVRRATSFLTMANYYEAQPVILKMHGSINYRYVVEKRPNQSDHRNPHLSYSGIFNLMMGNTPTENVGVTREMCIGLDDAKPPFESKEARLIPNHPSPSAHEQFTIFNIPLMLIPVHEKISPENNFFLSMIDRARKEIEAARIIVAIGYNFADQAFMNSLADLNFSDKSIVLVTSHPLMQTEMETHPAWKNIVASWKDAPVEFFEGSGFGEFVEALIT
jgi:SIR2-like domain